MLHHLGTVRLAAIRDVGNLQTASLSLRRMEAKMIKLLESIQSSRSAVRNKYGDRNSLRKVSDARFDDLELQQLKRSAKALSSGLRIVQKRLQENSSRFPEGISYRVDRSIYYNQQFTDGITSLRIGRVEGFRPYDEFVRRGLGDAIDFVAMLRGQISRIYGVRNAFVRYQQLVEDEIVARETSKRSHAIERLQEVADVALWVILAPYYAGTLIFHDFLGEEPGLFSEPGPHWGFSLIWGISALIGFLPMLTRNYYRWRSLKFLIPLVGAILAAAAFAAGFYGLFM